MLIAGAPAGRRTTGGSQVYSLNLNPHPEPVEGRGLLWFLAVRQAQDEVRPHTPPVTPAEANFYAVLEGSDMAA
jgi:hypothetical protein